MASLLLTFDQVRLPERPRESSMQFSLLVIIFIWFVICSTSTNRWNNKLQEKTDTFRALGLPQGTRMMPSAGLRICRRVHCWLQVLSYHHTRKPPFFQTNSRCVSNHHMWYSRKCSAVNNSESWYSRKCSAIKNSESVTLTHRLNDKPSYAHDVCGHRMLIHQSSRPLGSHTQTAAEEEVTFENIFSEANRHRVTLHLGTVKPMRTKEMMGVKEEVKISAVLVPLCMVNGEPSVLLTLRSSSLRKHRGEVSFPGGNQDDTDPDHVHTALRETFEEIGLNPRYFDVWGTLTPTPSSKKASYVTYPVLARYTKDLDLNSLVINTDEVEEVFTCSLRELCEGRKVKAGSTQYRTGPGYTLPVYLGAPYRIWGLTAIILHQVLTLVAPGLYTHKVRHVA